VILRELSSIKPSYDADTVPSTWIVSVANTPKAPEPVLLPVSPKLGRQLLQAIPLATFTTTDSITWTSTLPGRLLHRRITMDWQTTL
jgi:ABC-type antimicrobial peptide transport system ATPase subunit